MPDLSAQGRPSNNRGVFKYTSVGTAAGTTTIHNIPALLHSIAILNPSTPGTAVLYDSAGTSGTVIGTIANSGTFTQLPPLDVYTNNGLTVSNTANLALVVTSID